MAIDGVPYVEIGGPVHAELPGSTAKGPWVWARVSVDIGEPGRDLLDTVSVNVSVGYDPAKPFEVLEREAKDAAIDALEEALNLIRQP